MTLEDIASTFNCTTEQVELVHRVATSRLNRDLPLPLNLQDAQAVGLCLLTLQIAVVAHQPEDVAEVDGLKDEDLEVLKTLKPAFFNECISLDGRVGQFVAA